jgi:hypothetical protein
VIVRDRDFGLCSAVGRYQMEISLTFAAAEGRKMIRVRQVISIIEGGGG